MTSLDCGDESSSAEVTVQYDATTPHTTNKNANFSFSDIEKFYRKSSHKDTDQIIYVDFCEGNPLDPVNFSKRRKWMITMIAACAAIVGSTMAASFSPGIASMIDDLNCSQLQALVALGVYPLGYGLTPLITASFSEDFGRQPIYVCSGIGLALMIVMAALAKNITTVILARFLQGIFASPGSTMAGGTIADIWLPHERGLPMSIFVLIGAGSTGLGPVYASWVAMNPQLGWRWCQWIQLILCGTYVALVLLGLRETRVSVLLTKMAKKMRLETGNDRFRSRTEDAKDTMMQRIYISCTRPVRILCTEPVVLSTSLWTGLAWGVMFCMVASIPSVFQNVHGFNLGQTGTVYMTLFIGTILGFATNLYQETLYQKYYATRGPEARLHTTCLAAFLIPVGTLIYAWTSYSYVHWIAQAIGLVIFMWGTFIIYLASFSYVADCYGIYSSSALAGQGLFRSITATVFPLFTEQMFDNLGYDWGNTLFALLAVLMIPIPFTLYFYGPVIRRRSKISRMVMESQSSKQIA